MKISPYLFQGYGGVGMWYGHYLATGNYAECGYAFSQLLVHVCAILLPLTPLIFPRVLNYCRTVGICYLIFGFVVALFSIHRCRYIGGKAEPEIGDCVYLCCGCCFTRCGGLIGGIVASVLGTLDLVEDVWNEDSYCDDERVNFGFIYVVIGWSMQLLFIWVYLCLPAWRDGWELERYQSTEAAAIGQPEDPTDVDGTDNNPLSSPESDESRSLVDSDTSAAHVAV